jgi:hypothetical protein
MGETDTRCGLREGCTADYLGIAISAMRPMSRRFGLIGEVGFAQPETPSSDRARVLMGGTRFLRGRFFGQGLLGREWHRVFADAFIAQLGGGIDVRRSHSTRTFVEMHYVLVPKQRELSGLRVQLGFGVRLGSRAVVKRQ